MKFAYRKKALLVSLFFLIALRSMATDLFPRPLELQPNIAFWTRVYSEWTTDQIALTDMEDLRMVYRVVDVPPVGMRINGLNRDQVIKRAKDQVVDALRELDLKRPQSEKEVSGIAQEIYVALKSVDRADKYQRGDKIRGQNGLRDRFEMGYRLSGAHDREMKARLKRQGMPEELIAIAFVESLFYPTSMSHAGAAGIWQFMRGTAREFMRINQLVDERYDPILATEAAIKYLKNAKDLLVEWPLVITSYNYGRAGMNKAVNQTGSRDLAYIIQRYQHPRFGFAARNYYAEFLAALDVYRNADRIFPQVKPIDPWVYDVVAVPEALFANDLASTQIADRDWLSRHNPAFTSNVRNGKEVIPAGFTLRIPEGQKAKFGDAISRLPQKQKSKAEAQVRARHRANGRQRIFDIARVYDIFHDQLAKRLGYAPNEKPKRGSVILVRSADSRFSEIEPPIYRPGSQMVGSDKEGSVATAP